MLEWVRYYHLCLWMITWCVASLECKMHFSTVDSLFQSASIVCFFARETAHMLLSILLWCSSTVWDQLGKHVLQMSIHSSAVLTHVVVAKQCAVVMVNLAWLWFHIHYELLHPRSIAFSISLCSQISPGLPGYGCQIAFSLFRWPQWPDHAAGSAAAGGARASLLAVLAEAKLNFALRHPHNCRRYSSTTDKRESSAFNVHGFHFRKFLSRFFFFATKSSLHVDLELTYLFLP